MKKFLALLALLSFAVIGCDPIVDSSTDSSVDTPESSSVIESSTVEEVTTDVYFYNSEEWEEVAAYVFADDQPLFGEWPGDLAEDIGEGWFKASIKVDVSEQAFNIIFNDNGKGNQTGAAYIEDDVNVYVNVKGNVFDTKQAAIDDLTVVETTKIYFYNSNEWPNPNAYGWANGMNDTDIFGSWPGTAMTDEGDNWWSIVYPYNVATRPFNIIITDEHDTVRTESYLTDPTKVYLTIHSNVQYASKEDAIASLIVEEFTRVYFYNHDEWTNLHAYVYYHDENEVVVEPLGGWSGRKCDDAGENWWTVDVPLIADAQPFNVIFNGQLGEENVQIDLYIANSEYVYTSVNSIVENTKEAVLAELELIPATRVYFYNSNEWENVRAHVWYDGGDLFGNWPGKLTKDEGEGWHSILVYLDIETTPFNIIFNGSGGQTGGTYIEDDVNVYINVYNEKFATKEAAEESVLEAVTTIIYFYNSLEWDKVNAHVWYGEGITPFGSWPGKEATAEEDGWYSVEVPLDVEVTNFNVIFSNDGANQIDAFYLTDSSYVYITVNGVFDSIEAALASFE